MKTPINPALYEACLHLADQLMDRDPDPGTPEADFLADYVKALERFEARSYDICDSETGEPEGEIDTISE